MNLLIQAWFCEMAESQQTSPVNKEFHNQPLMNGAYQTIDSWGLLLDFHECLYNVGPASCKLALFHPISYSHFIAKNNPTGATLW